ncbi:Fic/DOC family protein [Gordonia soli]|uniref:protein adenylyltransferase n=1 Tax=Gordonia soli NBRC 108243 TaxID=1223545 RepID=M0QQ46_9ACTN|nr:Fic family protein [Gordonia soli]GAC69572.1 hypothetical protein GS4_26_00190 [Gordonia soli NBRC 108243]
MTAQDDWAATFIPGTTVLANKLGITDPDALAAAEYTITAHREAMIVDGRPPIARTYDAEHLHTIHAALFSPLYEWAGVPRTYPLSKDGLPFADPDQIGRYLDHARDHIAAVDWTDLDHGGFAVEAATVYATINMGHPYREGNGRTVKVFMSQLAADAGYRLDYGRVTPEQWGNAAMLSHPDRGTFEPVPDTMIPVFERITEPIAPLQPPAAEHAAPRETDTQRAARIASRGTSRRSPTSGSRSESGSPQRRRGTGYDRGSEGRGR